jgi:hypothetical protein
LDRKAFDVGSTRPQQEQPMRSKSIQHPDHMPTYEQLQDEIEHHKKMYAELLMSFHWAEAEMRRVREAALKLPRPWMDGSIEFDEWIAAVDKVLDGIPERLRK